jgi:predicted CXXCH cytochrome family protein
MPRKCTAETGRWSGGCPAGAHLPSSVLAILLGVGLVVGCATPEERYRTLRIFFDDVPVPESMRPAPVIVEVAEAANGVSRVSKQPAFDWVVHKPECKECHKSKTTQLPYLAAPGLCWDCHKKEDFANRFLHGPFAAGACLQCHSPHKSRHAKLLLDSPAELCAGCHDATTFAGLARHREEEGEDCTRCHSPHSAPKSYLLKADPDPESESESESVPELEFEPTPVSAPGPGAESGPGGIS